MHPSVFFPRMVDKSFQKSYNKPQGKCFGNSDERNAIMKLSIVTGGIWRRNSEMTDLEVIRELGEIGYRIFDFTFPGDEVGFENTVYMTERWKEEAEPLAAFMQEKGYAFGQAHVPMGPIYGNPMMSADEQWMWKGYFRAFEAASVLGAPYMVFHPGTVNPEISKKNFLQKNKEFFWRLLDKVEKYQIGIALENIGTKNESYHLYDGKALCELVEYIDHPLIGACWDTGHANLNRADQYESITALGKHLWCLHVADNVGGFEPGLKAWRQDLHTAPLMGVSGVNFDAVLQGLIDIDYKGTFNLEIEDPRPVWKKEFIYHGKPQNRLFYATDEMRKQSRMASYQIAKLMLREYGLDE